MHPMSIVDDGYQIAADSRLRVLHTPGHASNHICLLLENERMLFTGDHLMQGSTVVILPPDGSMRDYLASLERLCAMPIETIAPGHGALIPDAQAEMRRVIAHRMKREAKVVASLATAPRRDARRAAAGSLRRRAGIAARLGALFAAGTRDQARRRRSRAAKRRNLPLARRLTRRARRRPRLRSIELSEVSVRAGRALGAARRELDDPRRRALAAHGPNGSGKTMLMKLLRGDVWPTPTGREQRLYRLDDETHRQPLAARERIAYLGPEAQDKFERYEWNLHVADCRRNRAHRQRPAAREADAYPGGERDARPGRCASPEPGASSLSDAVEWPASARAARAAARASPGPAVAR